MEMQQKTKILLTGVGGPAGINMAKLLRERDDVYVVGCDVDETAAGQFFVDEFVIAPYVKDFDVYKSWMIEQSKNADIVVPTVDDELPVLAKFVEEVSKEVILSPKETLDIAADKYASYQWAKKELGENAPDFVLLSHWTEAWSDSESLFLKPRQGRGGRGCRVVSKKELISTKESIEKQDEWIVMELLPDTEWTVDAFVAKNGEIVYLIPRERLGLSGGISIKGRTVKNDAVIEVSNRLLNTLNCYGPVCLQFKADAAGVPKFVEINPRLSGGLMITVAAGANPVAAILSDVKGEKLAQQDWEEVTVLGHFEYKKL